MGPFCVRYSGLSRPPFCLGTVLVWFASSRLPAFLPPLVRVSYVRSVMSQVLRILAFLSFAVMAMGQVSTVFDHHSYRSWAGLSSLYRLSCVILRCVCVCWLLFQSSFLLALLFVAARCSTVMVALAARSFGLNVMPCMLPCSF